MPYTLNAERPVAEFNSNAELSATIGTQNSRLKGGPNRALRKNGPQNVDTALQSSSANTLLHRDSWFPHLLPHGRRRAVPPNKA